jgi:hypothetical protein
MLGCSCLKKMQEDLFKMYLEYAFGESHRNFIYPVRKNNRIGCFYNKETKPAAVLIVRQVVNEKSD